MKAYSTLVEVLNVIYFASNENTGVVRSLGGIHHDGNGYSSVNTQSTEKLVTEISAITVQTWPLRSRWPSRAGRPRSPEAREAPGPRCAGRLPLSLLEESVLRLRAQARSHPSVHHSSFQKRPRRPGELTRSAGIRDGTGLPRGVRSRVRVRSARGQLRPRVTCRLRAAAAAPAQAAALPAPHCHPRARGSLRALALSVHVLSPCLPLHFFPRRLLLLLPVPSFIS